MEDDCPENYKILLKKIKEGLNNLRYNIYRAEESIFFKCQISPN